MHLDIYLSDRQTDFLRSVENYPVTLYGGAKGGGKSHGLRTIMLLRRFEYANSIGYIFRKTYPELEANHIAPMFAHHPWLKEYYNESKRTLNLPNGSQLRFAYCEGKKDLGKFQGREMHDLGIEECGDWEYECYEFLRGNNRSSVIGVPARTMLTANPGGKGHKWLKRLFVEKRYEGKEKPSDYNFVKALVEDNPMLQAADPGYAERLESIKNQMLMQAFRFGNWDIAAGQFFSEFKRETHVLPASFKIQDHWPRSGSYDYGFSHPASWHWSAHDEDGNTYIYREIVQAGLDISQQAELVNKHKDSKLIPSFWAGRDCWSQRPTLDKSMPPTIAEMFAPLGIYLKPANIDRKQGAARMREYFALRPIALGKLAAKLFILETCPITIDCITRMTHNPDDPEDVLKVDSTSGDPYEGDDPYDSVRHLVMSRPSLAIKPKKWRGTRYDDEDRAAAGKVTWQTV